MQNFDRTLSRLTFARAAQAVSLPLVAACGGATEPATVTRLVVGTLASPTSAALEAPDTVRVGEPFVATVRTQGNACVQAAGGEAKVEGLTAIVTPRDMVYGGPCMDVTVAPTRAVPLRFDVAGVGRIRAVGAQDTSAERTIVVLPPR